MRHHQGLTLHEFVLVLALFGLLLLGLASMTAASQRSYQQSESSGMRLASRRAAASLLNYELGLAGYTGTGQAALCRTCTEVLPTLTVHKGGEESQPDAITVRYLEDRFLAEPQQKTITFEIGRDRRGRSNLYRREESAVRQPAVEDVIGLKLLGYLRPDGSMVVSTQVTPIPADLSGLVLELTFAWQEHHRFNVAFSNLQHPQLEGMSP